MEKLAIDVKVINALGQGHADPSSDDPQTAMSKYHDEACAHQQTAWRCTQQGITYAPAVITAQGGVGRHAEHIISRIASSIAVVEGISVAEVKAEIIENISSLLIRHAVRAVARRQCRPMRCVRDADMTVAAAACCREEQVLSDDEDVPIAFQ